MNRSLKDLLKDILPNQHVWKLELLQRWAEIVGDLQDKIKVEKIADDGTLIIGVSNSAWMQEVYFLSGILLKKINATLAQSQIKQLRFKYSPSRKHAVIAAPVEHTKEISDRLSDYEMRALKRIADEELREGLRCFLIRCRQYEGGSHEKNSKSSLSTIRRQRNSIRSG